MGSSQKLKSVGIKELKDRASEVVDWVHRTGSTVVVTKNSQEVAQVVPLSRDASALMMAAGLLRQPRVSLPLKDLELVRLADSSAAVSSILADREQ